MKNYGYYLIIILGFIYSQNFHYSEDDWYILKKPGAINAIVEDNFNLHFATENGIFRYDKYEVDFKYSYIHSLEFEYSEIRHMIYDQYRDYYWVVHSDGINYKSSISSMWRKMSLYNSGIFSYYEVDDLGISPNFMWLRSMNEIFPFDPFSSRVVSWEDAYDDKELIQWGYSRFGVSGKNLDISSYSINDGWSIGLNNITHQTGHIIHPTLYMHDDEGNKWFGTNEGYILKGWRNSYRLDLLTIGLPFNHVTVTYQDNEGNWWFGDSNYKRTESLLPIQNNASYKPFIARWDEKNNHWTYYNPKEFNNIQYQDINAILRLGSTMYFGTMFGLLYFDLLTEEWNIINTGLSDMAIWDIIEYKNSLYIATANGINEISIINHTVIPNKSVSYEILHKLNIYDMEADSNSLYLATNGGLIKMDWETEKLTTLSKKMFKKILINKNNIFGTDGFLWKIREGMEEEHILSNVNDFDVCGSYIWNSKGNKAILLDTISLQEWEYVQADGIPGKKIYSISCDKEWVWFSTNKGVAFYNWKKYHNENE